MDGYEGSVTPQPINPDWDLKYAKFNEKWMLFSKMCKLVHIVAKQNVVLEIDGCSNLDDTICKGILKLKKIYKEIHPVAYIIYHEIEMNAIEYQCKHNNDEIEVHMTWNYFEFQDDDPMGRQLAKKIYHVAKSIGCELSFTDIDEKIVLYVQT